MDRSLRFFLYALLDIVCIFGTLYIIWPFTVQYGLYMLTDYTGATTFTVFFYLASYYMLGCYDLSNDGQRDMIIRVLVGTLLGTILTGFMFFTFETWRFPRPLFILQFFLTLCFASFWRVLALAFAHRMQGRTKVILYGPDPEGHLFSTLSKNMPGITILGFVGKADDKAPDGLPFLGELDQTREIIREKQASMIVITPDAPLSKGRARPLLNMKLEGMPVFSVGALFEETLQRIPVEYIRDTWLLLEDGFNLNVRSLIRRMKRLMDVFVSAALLLVAWPFILAGVIAVKLESRGPAIYTQKRVGLHGREFTVYKIRSMRVDAEKNGAQWAQKSDPRVTRVGSFIRKVRIDELPQIFNVLKGDMSLVGPRPERMEFVRELEKVIPFYYTRHSVKPGVTGWAQVCYPYGASIEDSRMKLEYDLYYIKNMSLLLDIKIILKTIGVVLFPSGAR